MEPSDEQFAALKQQIEQLSKQLDLQKDFAALRQQVELEVSHLKWIGATVALLIAFFGFFGVKAWRDVTDTARTALAKQISQMSEQAFDLAHGFVLADARRYREAIPYLTKCYERNHFDESVTSAFLDALCSDGDYSAALGIIEELKADPKRFRQITNPLLYNNIGRVLIFYGIDKPGLLDEAERMLTKSLGSFTPDSYASKYPMFNLFRLYILTGDSKRAAQYLAAAYRIDRSEEHTSELQ